MLNIAPPQFVGELHRHVAGPALGGVERDDADWAVFAREQLAMIVSRSAPASSVSRQARPRRSKILQDK